MVQRRKHRKRLPEQRPHHPILTQRPPQRHAKFLLSAQDEPCQLSTLLNNPDAQANALSDAFACAAADLGNVFGAHVLDNLNTIIDDPANVDAAAAAVADIDNFRCCNVLPDVDLLRVDSADDFGVADRVPITAPREDACAAVDCGGFATSATCKSLGQ